jgi:hypothetical protein
MEKFQKYCFGVLLVMIYSNISVQAGKEVLLHQNCREFYQLCGQILESEGESQAFTETCDISPLGYKENKVSFTVNLFLAKKQSNVYKNRAEAFLPLREKHTLILKNYERKSKELLFAQILYFKTKVSKVRNKDYLSVAG